MNKKIYFVAIGGIGMSSLAKICHQLGAKIYGSDMADNYIIDSLKDMNIKIYSSHNSSNITDDIDLVVRSSIIKDDNIEIITAKEKQIKVIFRYDLLNNIISFYDKSITISGAHGKTTTTAILSYIFSYNDLDPTIINGGIIFNYNNNARLGKSNIAIAEADDSDRSFNILNSNIKIVTNIDEEHLENYNNDFSLMKKYYQNYIYNKDVKLAIICIEDKNVRELYYNNLDKNNNIIAYSINYDSDIKIIIKKIDIDGSYFDLIFTKDNNYIVKDYFIPIYGVHNILNTSSAIILAKYFKINDDNVKKSLANFKGVKRRFNILGEINQAKIIDDYAHHPNEIKSTLESANEIKNSINKNGKIILIFQPHKYSRTYLLFKDFIASFKLADVIIITDIYSASEKNIYDIDDNKLVTSCKKEYPGKEIVKYQYNNDLDKIINKYAFKDNIIICAGAGSISNWVNNIFNKNNGK